MQSIEPSFTVHNLTSARLREFIATRPEHEYVLIDVRQPEEYVQGHIPGARLMPLNELELHAAELKGLADRTLIFYCRSGGRSARASGWASRLLGTSRVANLLGGFMEWEGSGLPGFPALASFDLEATAEGLLWQALSLEKGTERFYEALASEYATGILAETAATLIKAESAHGRTVHELLSKIAPASAGSFEQDLAKVSGDLLENGTSFDVALRRAREVGARGAVALLELALEIELGAYDLYKNLALAREEHRPLCPVYARDQRRVETKALHRTSSRTPR